MKKQISYLVFIFAITLLLNGCSTFCDKCSSIGLVSGAVVGMAAGGNENPTITAAAAVSGMIIGEIAHHVFMEKPVKYDTVYVPTYTSPVIEEIVVEEPVPEEIVEEEIPEPKEEPRLGTVKQQIFEAQFKQIITAKPSAKKKKAKSFDVINFASGKATLAEESKEYLNIVVKVLNDYPDISLLIAAHTDGLGPARTNMALSKKRAESVKEYLVSKGIVSQRLKTIGHGEKYPRAANNTIKGRKKNRRVEFDIIRRTTE